MLVSLAVFAIGLLAVLTAILSALDLQKDSERRYRAGLILQEKLVEMSVGNYDGMPMQGVSSDGVFNWSARGKTWTGLPEVLNRSDRTSDADSLSRQLIEVAVDVSWKTTNGARSLQATQLVWIPTGFEDPQ